MTAPTIFKSHRPMKTVATGREGVIQITDNGPSDFHVTVSTLAGRYFERFAEHAVHLAENNRLLSHRGTPSLSIR